MSPEVALAGVAIVAAIAGLSVAAADAVLTRPRRPRPGPATMELGDEPPAVVDLVTDDFEVTTEAVPATLLDLAARGWLTIEEAGPGTVECWVARSEPADELAAYERRVLDHVRALAIDGRVPAQALTTGPGAVSARWWRDFTDEVIQDAQQRGLCQPRWSRWLRGVLGLFSTVGFLAMAAGWYVADYSDLDDTPDAVFLGVATGLVLLLGSVSSRLVTSRSQRPLPAGLEAGSRWLGVRRFMVDHGDFARYPAAAVAIWDRYLAHAAALDLAPLAVEQLPLGAEDPRHAYSSVTGAWRKVTVRYPRLSPGWGRHPAAAVLLGLVVTAAAAAVMWFGLGLFNDPGLGAETPDDTPAFTADDLPDELRWAGLGAALVAIPVATWWGAQLVLGLSDAFARREVAGVVIRTRCRARYSPFSRLQLTRVVGEKESEPRWYVAVDDGEQDEIPAWSVRRPVYQALRQGAHVRAVVTPRLRWLAAVDVVRHEPAPEPLESPLQQAASDLAAARQAAP